MVRPLDAGEDGGAPFVVYELVVGARSITQASVGGALGAALYAMDSMTKQEVPDGH